MSMKLEEEDARLVFGIVDGNKKIDSKLKGFPHNSLLRKFYSSKRQYEYRFSKMEIEKELHRTFCSNEFARLTTLFILAALLDPMKQKYLEGYYNEYVNDLDTICSYNWSAHIIEKLNESIKRKQTGSKKKQTGSLGCTLLLPYWLCERTKLIREIQPNLFPRFLKWDLEQLYQILWQTPFCIFPHSMIRMTLEQVTVQEQTLLKIEEPQAEPKDDFEEEMESDESEDEMEDDCSDEEMEDSDSKEENDGPQDVDVSPLVILDDDDSNEEMMDIVHCKTRKRVLEVEETVHKDNMKHVCIRKTPQSTETIDVDSTSGPNISDGPCDAENTRILRKELHEIDVDQEETTEGSNCDCTPPSNQFDQPDNYISKPALSFKDVKAFEDFTIYANGENLDKEIPLPLKMKYYELCCNQKEFLHAHLTKVRNSKLVAGMILETVSIADDIKAATMSTSLADLEDMDKSLNVFEDLGMAVAFLRFRLRSLVLLSHERQRVTDLKKTKLTQVEDERTAIQEKMSKIGYLEVEISTLVDKTEELDDKFKKVADSQW